MKIMLGLAVSAAVLVAGQPVLGDVRELGPNEETFPVPCFEQEAPERFCFRPIRGGTTPRSISLRVPTITDSGPEAAVMAQRHCRNYGRDAEFISRYVLPSGWDVMNFRCVDKRR